MTSTIHSFALLGIDALRVRIEVDIGRGLSHFMVVGLGDKSVQESKERVRAALLNSGFEFPRQRKIVNLAPADLKKCGPGFDLAIAIGLLAASGQLRKPLPPESFFFGELGLNGELRPTEGVLSGALLVQTIPKAQLFIPKANEAELHILPQRSAIGVPTLRALVDHLNGTTPLPPFYTQPISPPPASSPEPFSLFFPRSAWKALAVSAAGGHPLLLFGPPGSGKTVLASQLTHLLPPLTPEESIELTQVYSAAGRLSAPHAMIHERPFRSIHPSISSIALIGGGARVHPGEISLAHRGVLFLDEVAEFPRSLLESLRQPLESRTIYVARARGGVTFPAHFTLLAAMNPCPCGYWGDALQRCRCTPSARWQYQHRLSGPFLDRIDLRVPMPRLSYEALQSEPPIQPEALKPTIARALEAQRHRFGTPLKRNTDLTPSELTLHCAIPTADQQRLKDAVDLGLLSARGHARVLKVARTLADMAGQTAIGREHLEDALRLYASPFESKPFGIPP